MYILIQADLVEKRERVSTFRITNGLGDPKTPFYAGTFKIVDGDEVVKLNPAPADPEAEVAELAAKAYMDAMILAECRIVEAAENQVRVLFAANASVDHQRATSQELIDSVEAMSALRATQNKKTVETT